ncbi:hypothetical protein GTQ40_08575 [Flavobacteriaceae bacterium R38]|nr:hypothetical protein [Flavobacteriaceae bacterium R38]
MPETVLTCENCEIEISPVQVTCEHCGFPIAGTEKEKSIFFGKQIANKAAIRHAGKLQRRSSYILYIIGGFQIVTGGLSYRNYHLREEFILYAFIGLIFMTFGYFSSKKPILFISLGLGLILLLYALDFILDPSSILSGILWKIVIVGTLSYALISSFEEQKIKKKNKSL